MDRGKLESKPEDCRSSSRLETMRSISTRLPGAATAGTVKIGSTVCSAANSRIVPSKSVHARLPSATWGTSPTCMARSLAASRLSGIRRNGNSSVMTRPTSGATIPIRVALATNCLACETNTIGNTNRAELRWARSQSVPTPVGCPLARTEMGAPTADEQCSLWRFWQRDTNQDVPGTSELSRSFTRIASLRAGPEVTCPAIRRRVAAAANGCRTPSLSPGTGHEHSPRGLT